MKVLHPELAATIGSERFEREIKLAARLQHPQILDLYDSGGTDDLLWGKDRGVSSYLDAEVRLVP